MTEIQMTLSEFAEKYKPIKNNFDKHAGWDGCMFETYGDEHEHVLFVYDREPKKVWTVVDVDGDLVVVDGYHHVNRIGYLITEVPCEEDVSVCAQDEADDISICDDCGAEVPYIKGCPDGAEICQACFDSGKH